MTDLFHEGGAEISDCGRYRYVLWRRWDKTRPRLGFIMLNPSTADANVDDATIRVCMGRARRMGYGGIRVTNLFAFRTKRPEEMKAAADPFGDAYGRREFWLTQVQDIEFGGFKPIVIAAWGDDGAYRDAERKALMTICYDMGHKLYHLGLTKAGHPKHPLRIPYAVEPQLWIDGREGWLARQRAA